MNLQTVLLSAYACEPDKGSEPAAGWHWALELSQKYEVTVLTRANNKASIEKYLNLRKKAGESVFRVIYFDLPNWVLFLKKRHILNTAAYYIIWQFFARFLINQRDYDLVHHVTFNSFLVPGFWGRGSKLILGPLGGGMTVMDSYRVLFPFLGKGQIIRDLIIDVSGYIPWLNRTYRQADVILAANSETAKILSFRYGDKVKLLLDAGVSCIGTNSKVYHDGVCRFIVVGNIIPRKGWKLALDAVLALESRGFRVQLDFLGSGREFDEAQCLTSNYGLAHCVKWHGRVDHHKVSEFLAASDVLLFPSVRDTSGYVVLEAMASSMPVICLNHQGAGIMVDEKSGIRVPVGDYQATVAAFADAMEVLAKDCQKRLDMGKRARKRVEKLFLWRAKGDYMRSLYENILTK